MKLSVVYLVIVRQGLEGVNLEARISNIRHHRPAKSTKEDHISKIKEAAGHNGAFL